MKLEGVGRKCTVKSGPMDQPRCSNGLIRGICRSKNFDPSCDENPREIPSFFTHSAVTLPRKFNQDGLEPVAIDFKQDTIPGLNIDAGVGFFILRFEMYLHFSVTFFIFLRRFSFFIFLNTFFWRFEKSDFWLGPSVSFCASSDFPWYLSMVSRYSICFSRISSWIY